MLLDERRDASQSGNLRIVPDAGIAVSYAAAFLDRSGFHEDSAGAALRELAEVHEMPVRHHPVARGILAHRRNDDAVAQLDAAQLDRLK